MKILLGTFCSVLFAAAASSQAATARAIEDILPASTYACVKLGGLDACVSAANRLPVAGLVRRFVENLPAATRQRELDRKLDQAAAQVRQVLARQEIRPADARALLACPVALGIGRPTIDGMGPSVAAVLEVGSRDEAVRRVVQALEQLGRRHGVLEAVETAEVAGLQAHTWWVENGPAIHFAEVAGYLVVTNSPGYLREIVAVAAGKAPCLAKASTLGEARQLLPGTTMCSMFANAGPLGKAVEPFLPYEMAAWSKALGISRLTGVFAGTSAGEDGTTEVLRLGVQGSRHGLFKAAASQPLDLSMAAACSPNTVAFAAVRLDVPALIAAFDRFLDVLPGRFGQRARSEVLRELQRDLRREGTTPEEVHAILRAFGGQVTAALSLEAGMPKPELLVRLEVRDAERVAALLRRCQAVLADEGGLEWKQRDIGGVEVHFVNVVADRQFKLSPCYAMVDGALLLASDTQCLSRALRCDPAESLAAQSDFAGMQQAANGAFGVLHLRLARVAELGWRTVETMGFPLLDARADEIGFDSAALPNGEEMAAALGTVTTAAFVDEQGVTLASHGTLGSGSYLAGLAALADEVLRRAEGRRKVY